MKFLKATQRGGDGRKKMDLEKIGTQCNIHQAEISTKINQNFLPESSRLIGNCMSLGMKMRKGMIRHTSCVAEIPRWV